MSKYKPHYGMFYSDIGDGSSKEKIDFCFILPEKSTHGIIILKSITEVAAFDFHELKTKQEHAKVLNYKNLASADLAYDKMMKWIGKMIKKSSHNSRYYNNRSDKEYPSPIFLSKVYMLNIYKWMDSIDL